MGTWSSIWESKWETNLKELVILFFFFYSRHFFPRGTLIVYSLFWHILLFMTQTVQAPLTGQTPQDHLLASFSKHAVALHYQSLYWVEQRGNRGISSVFETFWRDKEQFCHSFKLPTIQVALLDTSDSYALHGHGWQFLSVSPFWLESLVDLETSVYGRSLFRPFPQA